MPHRRTRDTEPMDILLLWAVQLQGKGDPSVLNCPQTATENDHPILRKEVAAAVQSLKKGKSAGVDNISAELVWANGEDVFTALATICNKICQTGEWPTLWTLSLVITIPKKGNLQQCQNYRSISHPRKVMLKIILTSGEDRCWRTGRLQSRKQSTTEQIFYLRIFSEKYIQYQQQQDPPHWGSGEKTELKRSPFKDWSRSVYSHTRYANWQGFLTRLFLPFRSIHLHFFWNLSRFFPVGCG